MWALFFVALLCLGIGYYLQLQLTRDVSSNYKLETVSELAMLLYTVGTVTIILVALIFGLGSERSRRQSSVKETTPSVVTVTPDRD